jgi:hypothetical protein
MSGPTGQVKRDLRAVLDGTATEAQFQRVVIAFAKDRGWLVQHVPPAQVRKGKHVTPTQGHVGFPDLVLVRDGRLIFAELKSSGGPTDMQQVWLNRLEAVPGVEVHLWWPKHWPVVRRTLR